MPISFFGRHSTKLSYALLDGEFKIVRRVRISYIDPIVDLTSAAVQSRVSEYIITIDRWATKRLNNQRLRILCGDGMVREIRHVADMERNRYEVWLSTLSEMERYA